MDVIWDPIKAIKLKAERGIELDEIAYLIEHKRYLCILEHPKISSQLLFILDYHNYIHVVPCKIEKTRIIIKTCFPSRKYNTKIKG